MIENCGLEVCGNPEYGMNIGCKGCPLEIRKTVVVNLHKSSYTKYIGRGSQFGNQYQMGIHGSREAVIARHKKDFDNDPELQEAVWNELKGEVLGCFCKPLSCHGDTYVEYINNRIKETKDVPDKKD